MKLNKPPIIVLVILIVCGLSIGLTTRKSSAARNAQETVRRDEDLTRVFRKYDVFTLNTEAAVRQVKWSGQISIVSANKTYILELTQNDMRAPTYHAEETVEDGVRRPIEKGEVRTYKGFVRGMDNAEARFTIDEKSFEGMILAQGATYFVEPARRFSTVAARTDFVLYNEADVIEGATISCGGDMLNERVNAAIEEFAPRTQAISALRVAQLATEADFPFVQSFGNSVPAANAEILSLVNQIDAVYRRDLNITLTVTFQHGWATADPFPAGAPGGDQGFLNAFKDHWIANFPVSNPLYRRDLAHMWSNRSGFSFSGIAFIGVVCGTQASEYGWSLKIPVAPQKIALPAHEIGHNFGGRHTDLFPTPVPPAPADCVNTIMNAGSNDNTQLKFCQYSIDQILAYVNTHLTCLTNLTTRFDFDNDGKSDLAVFRPINGFWYVINSQNQGFSATQFGTLGDLAAPEDYDGDGRTDIGVFRPLTGIWYLLRTTAGFTGIQFGTAGDRPISGDFDGDGKADIGVYRPTTGGWYILNSNGGSVTGVFFGTLGDIPAPGDFDGDGKFDVAVFRPTTGYWYILQSRDGFRAELFGANGDRPDPADFDGDKRADLTVFRPSNGGWYIQQSTAGFRGQNFGALGDTPVAADFDGDGKADVAVWRPTDGGWYILNSSNGAFRGQAFGTVGDVPAPGAYVGP